MSVDKQDNFRRLAESRTNKIISSIISLGNLSNTSYYEYTPEQVEAVFSAIENEIKTQKERFAAKATRVKKFRL